MGILSGLSGFGAAVAGAISRTWTGFGGTGIGSRLRLLLPGSHLDYEREAGDLWQNSTVAICLRWIGNNYPKPVMRVSKLGAAGTWEPQTVPHKLISLVRRPNDFHTGRAMAKALCLSLAVDGNAYLVIFRGRGTNQPVQLWWVPHWLVAPVWPSDGAVFISHYVIRIDGVDFPVQPKDIIHFRDGIDPRNERLGIAPLKAQLREICSDNEVSGYTATILRNLGVPGLIITTKGNQTHVTDSFIQRLREKFRDTFSGENRGDAMFMRGEYDINKVGMSPEELRLDKLPMAIQARICAAMGVSPMVVGLPDPLKTYANQQEARQAAWENCLVPLGDLIAETLTCHTLPQFGDAPDRARVEFDYTNVPALQESEDAKSTRVRGEWKDGVATQNEAREKLGYEADPDGDRFYPGTGAEGDEPIAGTPVLGPDGKPLPGSPGAEEDEPDHDVDEEDDEEDDAPKALQGRYKGLWRL